MLRLIRQGDCKGSTYGMLYCGNEFVCYTLENTDKLIPTGVYNVKNTKSPKFGRVLPILYNENVSASRGIRIHRGNSKKDSGGCVLVGIGRNRSDYILQSTEAEAMLVGLCYHQGYLSISEE